MFYKRALRTIPLILPTLVDSYAASIQFPVDEFQNSSPLITLFTFLEEKWEIYHQANAICPLPTWPQLWDGGSKYSAMFLGLGSSRPRHHGTRVILGWLWLWFLVAYPLGLLKCLVALGDVAFPSRYGTEEAFVHLFQPYDSDRNCSHHV